MIYTLPVTYTHNFLLSWPQSYTYFKIIQHFIPIIYFIKLSSQGFKGPSECLFSYHKTCRDDIIHRYIEVGKYRVKQEFPTFLLTEKGLSFRAVSRSFRAGRHYCRDQSGLGFTQWVEKHLSVSQPINSQKLLTVTSIL